MPRIQSVGHVGLYVNDLDVSKDFYTRALGFQISDVGETGNLFMTPDPKQDHHQLVLAKGRAPAGEARVVQQVSFKVASLDELKAYKAHLGKEGVPIARTVSHGHSASIYLNDPDGNLVELYYQTPYESPPFGKPLNLDQSNEAILADVRASIEEKFGTKVLH